MHIQNVVVSQYNQQGVKMTDLESMKALSDANERMQLLKQALDVALAGLNAINVHKIDIAEKTIEQINFILDKE